MARQSDRCASAKESGYACTCQHGERNERDRQRRRREKRETRETRREETRGEGEERGRRGRRGRVCSRPLRSGARRCRPSDPFRSCTRTRPEPGRGVCVVPPHLASTHSVSVCLCASASLCLWVSLSACAPLCPGRRPRAALLLPQVELRVSVKDPTHTQMRSLSRHSRLQRVIRGVFFFLWPQQPLVEDLSRDVAPEKFRSKAKSVGGFVFGPLGAYCN